MLAGERWVYRNPVSPGRLSDEEITVATCLQKMAAHVDGGPAFYSIAQAAQDTYLEQLIIQSAETGNALTSTLQPWARD